MLTCRVDVGPLYTSTLYCSTVGAYKSTFLTVLITDTQRLQSFHLQPQRRIHGIRWHDFIPNATVTEIKTTCQLSWETVSLLSLDMRDASCPVYILQVTVNMLSRCKCYTTLLNTKVQSHGQCQTSARTRTTCTLTNFIATQVLTKL